MYQKTVLENGLRIVTSSMPHTRSVSIALYVGAGSRYETDSQAGLSHFLEHMLFKGTERRPTAQQISEEIEGVGGVMNAVTDKELTVYWAKIGHQHFERCLDVLADALLHSQLDPVEIEKERLVILEELAMTEDSPPELAGLLIDQILWPDQPLGRDVGGSPASVSVQTREDIVAYVARQYVPENTVLSVAGNVEHDQVVDLARRCLGDWPRGPHGAWYPAANGVVNQRLGLRSKKTEQVQMCLAVHGVSQSHPDRYAVDVMSTVLGDGMSSRLFLEVREKLALTYDIHSYAAHYQDAGAVVIGAGVDPKKVDPAIRAVLGELARLKDGVPEAELRKAKEYMKGRLQLRMEDTHAVSSWLGGQELLRGEIRTVDQILERIDQVRVEDVVRVGIELFAPERLHLAIVGPFRSEARFARLLDV